MPRYGGLEDICNECEHQGWDPEEEAIWCDVDVCVKVGEQSDFAE